MVHVPMQMVAGFESSQKPSKGFNTLVGFISIILDTSRRSMSDKNIQISAIFNLISYQLGCEPQDHAPHFCLRILMRTIVIA